MNGQTTSSNALVLAGPTACGKTAAALAVAQRWPIEIISVDSALVYQGMDIGTAKPTAQEQAAVPHHLIDIVSPTSSYSTAAFVQDATQLIGDINARGNKALLVGGTMLYVKALLQGIDAMPPANPQVRNALEAQAQAIGWPAMHQRLSLVDPVTAQRLAPNDSQRVQRALEVFEVSGKPLSQWHTQQDDSKGLNITLLSLEPTDRAWLHQRINQRFEAMLDLGFEAEMLTLFERGDLNASMPSMRCVGYRQAWELLTLLGHLDGPAKPIWIERASAATRQLAKRQITWLRGMTKRQVIAANANNPIQAVIDTVARYWD
ncbi:tRNA (adenosine(37)-N6)-dimethylallyltransferase MiaA [Comamonadaceae bacterium M7527]|nr:tRNA (adenosine(37)-N6)-dimethylallyltransferase MiaA [Comamonadaceae bacterium M7527]